MQHSAHFAGIIPPVSTIFTPEGDFDRQGTGALIDNLIAAGVDGLFFLGSGGEFSQLNVEERKNIAAFAIAHVNGRVPVLIGTGGNECSRDDRAQPACAAKRCGWDCRYQSLLLESL